MFILSVFYIDFWHNILTDYKNNIFTACINHPADIFFVVDKSSSLQTVENFNKELSFVARFVQDFNIGPGLRDSRVGLLTFRLNWLTYLFKYWF